MSRSGGMLKGGAKKIDATLKGMSTPKTLLESHAVVSRKQMLMSGGMDSLGNLRPEGWKDIYRMRSLYHDMAQQ